MPKTGAATAATRAATTEWQSRAVCRKFNVDPDIFFGRPDKYGTDRHAPAELAYAKSVCGLCDAAGDCLAAALDGGPDVYGVWGGSTREDRERLRRGIPRVKCPMCASKNLIDNRAVHLQVCGSCGNSWPTARPTQTVDTAVVA